MGKILYQFGFVLAVVVGAQLLLMSYEIYENAVAELAEKRDEFRPFYRDHCSSARMKTSMGEMKQRCYEAEKWLSRYNLTYGIMQVVALLPFSVYQTMYAHVMGFMYDIKGVLLFFTLGVVFKFVMGQCFAHGFQNVRTKVYRIRRKRALQRLAYIDDEDEDEESPGLVDDDDPTLYPTKVKSM